MHLSLPIDDVLLAQRGDPRALDRVVRAVSPSAQAMLRRFPLSEEDRHDALQNTLLRVCLALPSYRQEARFSTWLYRVCANEALMLMRKVRVRQSREADVDPEDVALLLTVEAEEPGEDRHEEVQEALASLPEHYRSVLAAYYGEGRGLDDIAASSVETESAVRARVHRARQLLRRRLEGSSRSAWTGAPQYAA
jgi:RNA polymerase sigma-70 factor (ECF subfamily)